MDEWPVGEFVLNQWDLDKMAVILLLSQYVPKDLIDSNVSISFGNGLALNISAYMTLTHWGLVMPYGDRDLGQHWLR